MPICRERNLIFIHIPKTAGTSIEKALGLFGGVSEERLFGMDMQHMSASEIKARCGSEWEASFKFSLVRDPLERLISEHSWRINAMNISSSLEGFVLYNLSNYKTLTGALRLHIMPQSDFLDEDVDLIGEMENLDIIWPQIQKRGGFQAHLEHHNRSDKNPPPPLSAQAAGLLIDFYSGDYDRFDYAKPQTNGLQPSVLLQELDRLSQSLPQARAAIKRYKSNAYYHELALLCEKLRVGFPQKEIGWIHGIEACSFIKDYGTGLSLIRDGLEHCLSLPFLRLAHNLARSRKDIALMLQVSGLMVRNWPDEPDAHYRHIQVLLKSDVPPYKALEQAIAQYDKVGLANVNFKSQRGQNLREQARQLLS